MQDLLNEVQASVTMEYNRASKKFGLVSNSHHESYAVIKEEYEEAMERTEVFERQFEHYWSLVKQNRHEEALAKLTNMQHFAINAAAEWIQVAAMCFKATK